MEGPTTARSRRPVRATRSPAWTAIVASLAAMAVTFIVMLAFDLTSYTQNTAPTVTVATSAGLSELQLVTVTREQVESSSAHSVTVRLRNDSSQPVHVAVVVNSPSDDVPGTLTAALTMSGAVVRNGALSTLRIPEFTLDADATTPLTLDIDANSAELAELWDAHGDLTIAVSASH